MIDAPTYVMTCPHCKQMLKFGDRAIGKTKDCPRCKTPIVVAPEGTWHPVVQPDVPEEEMAFSQETPLTMSRQALENLVRSARCRIFGWEDAGNDSHRGVLAILIQGCGPDSTVLCEPSLARKTTRPPDVVFIDPLAGIHVLEVKGVTLDQIEALEPGGAFRIRYDNGVRSRNPIAQVRTAMFDIKDAVERGITGDLVLPLKYWVVIPRISRTDWMARWGENAHCPPEFLFSDDLQASSFAARLTAVGQKQLSNCGMTRCPADQLDCVWQAFGDSSVLYHKPEDREARKVTEGTLGELFDERAEVYKALSEDQQRLSSQDWEEGPRLVRGVVGSGKTVVLANNLARRFHRQSQQEADLFAPRPKPRILAVCNNRSLVPFLKKKIDIAYQQRTGRPLPEAGVDVFAFNKLMWHLKENGLWRYQHISAGSDADRAAQYLKELQHVKANEPSLFDALAYDAIYVDEGQDFCEEDFCLLMELCRTTNGGEPNLYVFYDDAQNLLGRKRPNWQSLGLNVRGGRACIMTECFRNTRQIVEPAFNVLYGSFAASGGKVPSKEYGGITTLQEKGLIEHKDGVWHVQFTKRDGLVPTLSLATDKVQEAELLIARLRYLVEEQHVRPEDIQVLSFYKRRIRQLAEAIQKANLSFLPGVHLAFEEQDHLFGRKGLLSLSTVGSAKGYDAYCVLLASANEFDPDITGRVTFYVGCTRAIEYLEVFAYEKKGLVLEFERALPDHQGG